MKKKYLKFYKECMKTGVIPTAGLCSCFPKSKELRLFQPNSKDLVSMHRAGESASFWGFGENLTRYSTLDKWHSFSTRRQTIILFCAALNGEL